MKKAAWFVCVVLLLVACAGAVWRFVVQPGHLPDIMAALAPPAPASTGPGGPPGGPGGPPGGPGGRPQGAGPGSGPPTAGVPPPGPQGAGGPPGQRRGPPAAPVELAAVEPARIRDEITAIGSLQSNESVIIQPEIEGRITRILFKEGERVEAGQALIEIDSTILKAQLAKARSDLQLAQTNFDRAGTLARDGSGTQRALDEASARLAAARAEVALATARLEKATIAAPFAGVLGLRELSVGTYVTPGRRIVNLESIDPIKVDFSVPEVYLSKVTNGQAVEARLDALPGKVFTGTIYAMDPMVDQNGRAIRVRALIPNPEGLLRPGLFARIGVIAEVREAALTIPEAALVPGQGGQFVFRVVDGKATRTAVRIGRRLPGKVEIVEGLAAGEKVVVAGQARLRDGAAVDAGGGPPGGRPGGGPPGAGAAAAGGPPGGAAGGPRPAGAGRPGTSG